MAQIYQSARELFLCSALEEGITSPGFVEEKRPLRTISLNVLKGKCVEQGKAENRNGDQCVHICSTSHLTGRHHIDVLLVLGLFLIITR